MNNVHEEVSAEIANAMPTMREIVIHNCAPLFLRIVPITLFGLVFAFPGAAPAWLLGMELLLFFLSAMILIPLVFASHWFAQLFMRSSLLGSSISTHDGRIIFRKANCETVEYLISECQWRETSDLQKQTGQKIFPHLSCIVVVPPGITLFHWKPLIACGFTDEMRRAWRDCFSTNGATKVLDKRVA